jgi:hypothetical protein
MNAETNPNLDNEMLDEYDFSQAVRGNPYSRLSQSSIKIETKEGDRQVQIKTVEALVTVTPDGKVTLQLPPDVAPGEHHVTLLIQENVIHRSA